MCDQQTYDHYPENVRLEGEALLLAEQMIRVGGNKKNIKMHLMKVTGKPVLTKTLHNIQTKNLQEKQAGSEGMLQKLYNILDAIPNANVCFISDEEDELVGKLCRRFLCFVFLNDFFQDERMQHLYAKYPEVILYDATYKLNNLDMPLFTQCVIDGNGQTEIASLFFCKSESREGIGAMLDVFKQYNRDWSKTIVIIGDKDFADRAVYKEQFL